MSYYKFYFGYLLKKNQFPPPLKLATHCFLPTLKKFHCLTVRWLCLSNTYKTYKNIKLSESLSTLR